MIYGFEIYIDNINNLYSVTEYDEETDLEHDEDMLKLNHIKIWYNEIGEDYDKHDIVILCISDKKISNNIKNKMYKKAQKELDKIIKNKQKEINSIKDLQKSNKFLKKNLRIKKINKTIQQK